MTENFDFDYESSIPKNPPIVTFGVDSTSNRFHYHHVGGIGSSLTGNPYASPDVLSLNSHTIPTSKNHLWKYNEEQILKDVSEYVTSTYGSHYCGQNQEYKDGVFKNRMPLFIFNFVTLIVLSGLGAYFIFDFLDTTLAPWYIIAGQVLVAFLIDDLFFYFYHRYLHENKFLLKED